MKVNFCLKVTRIDFDNMENRDGEGVSSEHIFADTPDASAFTLARAWIEAQPARKCYLGWNKQVYPQYRVTDLILSAKE